MGGPRRTAAHPSTQVSNPKQTGLCLEEGRLFRWSVAAQKHACLSRYKRGDAKNPFTLF